MAEPHVVAALKDKRAELSGSIAALEKRIGQHRADLLHVDAVLRLFAPEFEPATILPRAVRRPNSWFKPGELARLGLEELCTAPTPLRKLASNALTRQGADLVERIQGQVGLSAPTPSNRSSSVTLSFVFSSFGGSVRSSRGKSQRRVLLQCVSHGDGEPGRFAGVFER